MIKLLRKWLRSSSCSLKLSIRHQSLNNQQNMINDESYDNLKKCPHFNECNQNLCPLDIDLSLRIGGPAEKCRWMRPPLKKTIHGKVFISGGQVMPNGLLNFVPESNLEWLNTPSKKRWMEIKENETKS